MASRGRGKTRGAGFGPRQALPPPRMPGPRRIGAIKVIGLGGIGAPLAQALVQFLAYRPPCPTVWLVDGDTYEEKNRERVVFEACLNKAAVKARELTRATQGRVTVVPVEEYVTSRNVRRLIDEGDVIFLAVDNHASRALVSRRCADLAQAALISGGNDGVVEGKSGGTFGNVQIYLREDGRDRTNAITRFHPEIARPADRQPDQDGCADLAPSAPQLLFTNLTVAAAMLGTFHAWLAGTLDWEEVYLDIAQGRMTPVKRALAGAGAGRSGDAGVRAADLFIRDLG
jgi:molybdopterin/thiamine biosynthesis adenylyltransferase